MSKARSIGPVDPKRAPKPRKPKREPKRIPYAQWASSHLSIAKYYGGCTFNGVRYVLDYKNCERKIIDGEERLFPDLVEVL